MENHATGDILNQHDRLQRQFYQHMKRRALSLEAEGSKELRSYQKEQLRLSKRSFDLSDINQLISSFKNSSIVFMGDFHSLDQNSRNVERIIKLFNEQDEKFILGVEFAKFEHQRFVDSYLDGHITEIEFLDSIEYQNNWRFPWSHYRRFMEIAKNKNLLIRALNSPGTLPQRDKNAANYIKQIREEFPDKKIIILFGEYHILPKKLPGLVKKLMPKESPLIIHQNLDSVYWALEKEHLHDVHQIVKFNKQEFCLQTSAPWIKYESMVYWYENLLEDPDYPVHEIQFQQGALGGLQSSAVDTFLFLSHQINQSINLEIDKAKLEDFNLYDFDNAEIIDEKIAQIKKATLRNFFLKKLENGEKFHLPHTNILYCSGHNINRIAHLVGVHLIQKSWESKGSAHQFDFYKAKRIEIFIYFLYQQIFAYFCSKIVNPYRKCDQYLDFHPDCDEVQILDQMATPLGRLQPVLKGKSLQKIDRLARKVGFILGEFLFEDFQSQKLVKFGRLSEQIIRPRFLEEDVLQLAGDILPRNFRKAKKRHF